MEWRREKLDINIECTQSAELRNWSVYPFVRSVYRDGLEGGHKVARNEWSGGARIRT